MSIHDPQKEVISMKIYKNSCYECEILKPLLSALQQNKRASLIDMGGNIGMYSLHVAALSRNVIAFEPLRLNQQKFCTSINKNDGFKKFVKLVPRALTKEKNVTFVQFDTSQFRKAVFDRKKNQTNFGSMQTRDGQEYSPSGELGRDYALATTLDSFLKNKYLPSKDVVLKVDIEGSECKAIAGGFTVLKKLKIKYVAIEMTPERLKACEHWNQIIELFFKNGLKSFKFDKRKKKWVAINIEERDWNQGMYDLAFSKNIPETFTT